MVELARDLVSVFRVYSLPLTARAIFCPLCYNFHSLSYNKYSCYILYYLNHKSMFPLSWETILSFQVPPGNCRISPAKKSVPGAKLEWWKHDESRFTAWHSDGEKLCLADARRHFTCGQKSRVFTVKFAGSEVKEKILKWGWGWEDEGWAVLVTCNLSPHH